MTVSRISTALLAVQLALVSSIAAKYLYERQTCPRVWTRAVAYDPSLIMRGRYLSIQLRIDACGIRPHLAKDQPMTPEDNETLYFADQNGNMMGQLPIIVGVQNGRLAALRIEYDEANHISQDMTIQRKARCSEALLQQPTDFYISESAQSPFPLAKGAELWVEVTIPPLGPPRPLALAIKSSNGHWQPLNYR